MHLALAEEKQD